jgi:hypothetical protein
LVVAAGDHRVGWTSVAAVGGGDDRRLVNGPVESPPKGRIAQHRSAGRRLALVAVERQLVVGEADASDGVEARIRGELGEASLWDAPGDVKGTALQVVDLWPLFL